jgi:hypothetical protein
LRILIRKILVEPHFRRLGDDIGHFLKTDMKALPCKDGTEVSHDPFRGVLAEDGDAMVTL